MKYLRRFLIAHGVLANGHGRSSRSENGDTLIEVLVALIIMGVAVLSLLLGFSTSLLGAFNYRNVATIDTVLRTAAEEATAQLQQQSSTVWGNCTGASQVIFTLPSGYTATIPSPEYWNSAATKFIAGTCVPNAAQLDAIYVTFRGTTYEIDIVVDDPLARPVPAASSPYQLVFLSQPNSGVSASVFSPAPVVAIEDANGNIVTTDLSTVSLSITPATNSGGATLSSNCSEHEFYGVVTFANCSMNTAGNGYTLTASDGTLVPAVSTPFNITPGSASQLVFTPNPPTSIFTGVQFSVSVTEEDVYGNIETSDSTTTLNLAANGGGFSCTTAPTQITNGVASYYGCSFATTSTAAYTLTASSGTLIPVTATTSVVASAATQLVYLTGPQTFLAGTGTAAGSGAVMVQLQNASGNPVIAATPIALNFTTSGSGVNYIPTFGSTTTSCTASTPCTIPAGSSVGTFYMTDSTMNSTQISVTTWADGLQTVPQTETVLQSSSFNGSVGISSQSGVLSPTGTAAYTITVRNTSSSAYYFEAFVSGVPISAASTLTPASSTCERIAGNSNATWSFRVVTNGSTPSATLQFSVVAEGWATSSCSGTLGEDTETSGTLTITPGLASKLVFVSNPPASVLAGTQFSVVVVEQDAYGNTKSSDSTTALSLGANNGGGGFSCASPPTNVTNGIATYTGCYFTVASATSYTLTASSSGLSSASATILVSDGPATTIAISSGSSQSTVVYTPFASPLIALVTDAYGNPIPGATVIFTVPGSGASGTFQAATNGGSCLSSGGSVVASCAAITNANGLASSLTLTANKVAGNYNIAATSSGIMPNPLNFAETNSPDVPPVNNLSLTGQTGGGSYLSGTTVYYRGSTAGSFTITNALTDTGGSGPASSAFPVLGGTTTNWTHTGSTLSTPAGGPYVSGTFSWSSGTTSSPTEVITGTDNVGNTAVTTLTFVNDTTTPAVSSTVIGQSTNATISGFVQKNSNYYIYANISDSGSGVQSVTANVTNVTSGSSNVALTAGSFTAPGGGSYGYRSALLTSNAIQVDGTVNFTVNATDNVGDASAYSNNGSATFDSTPPMVPTPTVTAKYYTTASVPVTLGTATDSGSGVNTSSVTVLRASATLSGGVCGTFGSFSTVTLSSGNDTTVASGNCYEYEEQVADNVGNVNTSSASNIAKVDTAPPLVPPLAFSSMTNVSVNGTTVYYRSGATSGSFTVTASSTDAVSGIASYGFPTLGSGWTATAGSLGVETYSWSTASPTTGAGPFTVTATNGAGLASGGTSFSLVADHTAPVNSLTLSSQSGGESYLSGTTVYYRGSTTGSFTITNALSDTGSGPASSAFPALGGTATGWTHTASTVSTPTGGPYVSTTFSWTAGTASGPTETITGTDNVGNTVTTTLTFVNDSNSFTQTSPSLSGYSGHYKMSFTGTTSSSTTVTVYICPGADSSCSANSSDLLSQTTATPSGNSWTSGTVSVTQGTSYISEAYQTDQDGIPLVSNVEQFTG
jgi:type II secretory pathway pseudopilin PulG